MRTSSSRPSHDDRGGGLDRRRFLGLVGAGGVGVAGLSAFALPGLAWAETIDAITLGERLNKLALDFHHGDWQWAEQCQAAQRWAEAAVGVSPTDYLTANDARVKSGTLNLDPSSAPAGSFSWFNASSSGHVVTNIGNGYCINTSPLADGKHYHTFATNLYISKVADYKVGAYLGWTRRNGVNPQIPVQAWSPSADDDPGSDWAWNAPDSTTQKRVQVALAKRDRYSGPQDGQWGINSIKGIQTTCKNVGYDGPVDGKPGPNTCHYVQVYAKKFGSYTGPVDSVLGPNSWSGFALGLERP
jgi:hypothetical protein